MDDREDVTSGNGYSRFDGVSLADDEVPQNYQQAWELMKRQGL